MREKSKPSVERGTCCMSNNPQHDKAIPLLRFWTWRYALILLGTLVVLGLLAGFWMQMNTEQQSFQVLQARAEQLGDSYVRAKHVIQLQRIKLVETAFKISPTLPATTAVPYTSTIVMKPLEIARPIERDYMQIFNKNGAVLDSFGADPTVPVDIMKPSSHQKLVLEGKSIREKIRVNGVTWLRVGVPLWKDGTVMGALYLSAPPTDNMAKMKETYEILALVITGIAFGGWTVIYLLSRKLTRPLRQLAGAAIQVAEGDYSPDLPLPSDVKEDELKQLVTSFNTMTERLKQLEQLRTDLLAGVSHELRTPVTSIRGMVQAVQRGVVTGEKADRFLLTTLEEAKRMQKMVEDLLEFSSLEAGVVQGEQKWIPVSELITEVTQQMQAMSFFKSVKLETSPPSDPVEIRGDRGQLKQILMNLLANSVAAGATHITLEASLNDHNLVIDVADNGKGIKEAEVPYIFERYYRGDSKRKKKHGLGLGLPLSRLLAKANGGELFLLHTSEKGTVFRLSLPKQ